jgi:hypothetical protein
MDLIVDNILEHLYEESVCVSIQLFFDKPIKKFIPLATVPFIRSTMESTRERWYVGVDENGKCLWTRKTLERESMHASTQLCEECTFLLGARGYKNPLGKTIVRMLTIEVDTDYI